MRNLGQLEALVMDRLWSAEAPLSVRQVLEGLPEDRHRAYTTVMTVLDNLFRKGFVDRELSGRAFAYRAVQSREQHTAELMESVLAEAGDRGAALMHFIGHLTSEEAEQLRSLLAEVDARPGTVNRLGRTGRGGTAPE